MGNHPSFNRDSSLVDLWWRNSRVRQIHSRDGLIVYDGVFIMTIMRGNLTDDWVNSLRGFTSTLVGLIVGAVSSIRPF
jgi:hypothetical protein